MPGRIPRLPDASPVKSPHSPSWPEWVRAASAAVMSSARMTMTPCDLTGWMPCAASVVDRSAKAQPSYSPGLWVASRVSTVCVRTRRSPPITCAMSAR